MQIRFSFSGTGKTTCLVFRMWAMYMQYVEGKRQNTKQPRQLFVTKNPVLRGEVEKSFWNMGLAFRKRTNAHNDKHKHSLKHNYEPEEQQELEEGQFPLFLTASEWLNILGKK